MQITCRCSKYKFPHRLSGGKCLGDEWAQSYYLTVNEHCKLCNCNNEGICEVATGQESIKECEGYIDFLHTGSIIKLPRTEEDMLEELCQNRYNEEETCE